MDNLEVWAAIVSALIAAIALAGNWQSWRSKQLRRDDVLAWGNEAITALQTLVLICVDGQSSKTSQTDRLAEVRFSTSVLVERGRLFFRNANTDHYGDWKEPAYQGYRPRVLDHLVVAYQIATAWPSASEDDRKKMCMVAESTLRQFVSLLQKEVGRDRTAAADTSQGGNGADLHYLMKQIDPTKHRKTGDRF